jgi:hypothetical protein
MNLLDVIAFIPNPGIGVASSLEPGPASEMAEKTVLQFLLAQFGGYSEGYAMVAAVIEICRISACRIGWLQSYPQIPGFGSSFWIRPSNIPTLLGSV